MILFYLGYTLFILVCGMAIGATLLLDFFAWLHARPRPIYVWRAPLPVARLLSRAEMRRLEVPTVMRRRQVIDVIDVAEVSRG